MLPFLVILIATGKTNSGEASTHTDRIQNDLSSGIENYRVIGMLLVTTPLLSYYVGALWLHVLCLHYSPHGELHIFPTLLCALDLL